MKILRLLFLGVLCAVAFPAFAQLSLGTVDPGPYTPGSNIAVTFAIDPSQCIQQNNRFNLRLSDASGNFTPGVIIGFYDTFYSTFVNGTIPAGTAAGTGYKVRVESTNPALISNESAAFTIQALPAVTVNISTNRPFSPANSQALGFCSPQTGTAADIILAKGSSSGDVTATLTNELNLSTSTINLSPSATFRPVQAHYTMFAKVTMPNGTVATRAYFIINNKTITTLNTSGSNTVCLQGAGGTLTYPLDPNALLENFPGDTYRVNWGDLSTDIYTICDLKNGFIQHTYTQSSCGQTITSGGVTTYNSFGVNLQLANPFCGNVGTPISTSARVINVTQNRITGPLLGCTNTNITFTNASLLGDNPNNNGPCLPDNATFNWYVDGNFIQSGSINDNLVYNFTTNGIHVVELESISATGCQGPMARHEICIQNPPQPSFTIIPSTICAGSLVIPNNTSVVDETCNANTIYTWTVSPSTGVVFTNGTNVNSRNPQILFNNTGIYSISLSINTLTCGSVATLAQTITVNTTPQAILSADFEACQLNTYNFDTTNGPTTSTIAGTTTSLADTYTWTVTPAGAGTFTYVAATTASSRYPSIRFNSFDVYTVTVVHQNNCGTATDTQVITFSSAPVVDAGTYTAICYNTTSVLLNGSITGNTAPVTGITWSSTGGGTFSPNANTLGATYTPSTAERNARIANLTLTVTTSLPGSCGIITDNASIVIKDPVTVSSAATKSICTGSAVGYTPTSTSAGATFAWSVTASSANASGFSASGTGNINDILTNTDPNNNATVTYTIVPTAGGCDGDPFIFTVTITPLPTVTPTAANLTICSGQSSGITMSSNLIGTRYTWTSVATGGVTGNINNTTPTTATTINQTLVNAGTSAGSVTYTITPISTTGCTGTPSALTITVEPQPTQPNAGLDAILCHQSSYVLSGNTPTVGTGKWTQVTTFPGISFLDDTQPNTTVNGLQDGNIYTFRWTITGAASCAPKTDDVSITINQLSDGGVTAGSTSVCAGTNTGQITLSGQVGNIVRWERSTDNFATSTVINTTLPSITYNNLSTTTQFRAVVKNGSCGEANSTVATVIVNQNAVAALAGPDQNLCSVTSAVLAGNDPLTNTGFWTITSGQTTTSFVDATKYNTTVNGLVAGQTYTFRWTIASPAPCPSTSDDVIVRIDLPSDGGVTAGSTSVCTGTNTGQITLSGQVGNIVRWERSTDNFATSTVINTTLPSITYTNLTATTQYRAVVKNGSCGEANSTVATITVNQNAVAAIAGPDQNLCSVTSTVLAGNDPLTNTGFWTITSGQTTTSFVDATKFNTTVNGLVAGQTYTFRWTIASPAPCPSTSDDVIVKVDLPSDGGVTAGSTSVCAGNSNGQITLSGQVGNIIRWERSTDNFATSTVINSTLPSITYNNLTATTQYRAVVKNGSCGEANSTVATITVNQGAVAAIAGPDQNLCSVTSTVLAGNDPGVNTGLWTITSGQTTTSFVDATKFNTTVNGLVAGQTYTFRWAVSGLAPCPSSNDDVIVKIDLLSNGGTTAGSTSVCAGNSNGLITLSGQVGNIVRWESSTDNFATTTVINTTLPSITYTNLTITTKYRAVVKNGSCGEAISTVATVTVNQAAVGAVAGPDQNLCNATSTILAGNDPGANAGLWTITSGQTTTSFVDATKYNTVVNGLMGGQTYTFRWTISGAAPCPSSNDDIVVSNLSALQNNAISTPATTNCTGQTITLTGTLPTGANGTYTYVWQSSPTGVAPWTTIAGQTGRDLNVIVSSSLSYQRIVSSGVCSTTSNIITITALAQIANNTIAADQTICLTTTPNAVTGSQPTGGDGTYTYSWEQSTDNGGTWSVVTGINTQNYSPPAITQTTLYRRLVASSVCAGSSQSVSNSIKITVNLNARAEFTYTNDLDCVPFKLDASNIKAVPYPAQNATYTWYADGTNIGSGITFPGYTIATDNTSVVIKLVTTSSLGCITAETSHTFTTRQNITASFTPSTTTGCGPLSVNFTNTSTSLTGVTFDWSIDGTSISSSTNFSQVFAGSADGKDKTYVVKLVATTICGSTESSINIIVKGSPIAAFFPDKSTGCSPLLVTFNNVSQSNSSTYTYDFGDGSPVFPTTSKNPVQHTFTTNVVRTFTIKMTEKNECGEVTNERTIVVSPNAITPSLTVNGNNLRGCAPFDVTFFNNTVGASEYTYDFKDGTTPLYSPNTSPETQTHRFNLPGTYRVELKATNACPSIAYAYVDIIVDPQPSASFTSNTNTGCAGLSVKFTNTSKDAVGYSWDFGDGSLPSNDANPTHVFNGPPGQYNVKLTAINSLGCTNTTALNHFITIVGPPVADFSISPAAVISIPDYTFRFTDESTNNPQTYKWSFGDGDISSLKDPTHKYTDTGKYLVTMRTFNEYGCVDSIQKYVQIVGVPGYVYVPNSFIPGGTSVPLQKFTALGSGIKSWRMQVFNKWGQVLWETTKLDDGKPIEGWDGTYNGVPQPQGIYFWKIDVELINGTEWKGMTFGRSAPKRTGEIYLIR